MVSLSRVCSDLREYTSRRRQKDLPECRTGVARGITSSLVEDGRKVAPEGVLKASFDEILERSWTSRYPEFYDALDKETQIEGSSFDLKTPYKRDAAVLEPILNVVAFCDNGSIKVTGFDVELTRD